MAKSSALRRGFFQGEYAEGRAKAQVGGCLRHGGQKELWARTDAKGIEMLLAHPDRIEAELFSVDHELRGVFVVGDLSLAIGEKVKQGKQAELHSRSSFCSQLALADLLLVMIWVFVPLCFGAIPSCGDTEPLLIGQICPDLLIVVHLLGSLTSAQRFTLRALDLVGAARGSRLCIWSAAFPTAVSESHPVCLCSCQG
jgi:hypothetical protein